MDFHLNDEEFEQLLQSLDDIPPGNLPQDGIYPFNFPEACPSITTFVEGGPLDMSKAGGTGYTEMHTEELKAQVEELKKQNEAFMILVKDLRTYLYGVQAWMEQVSVILQQRLGESIESAAELDSEV
ncbi:hypothetical protein BDW75DRAFT_234154 [Aspergillus navahoensis]